MTWLYNNLPFNIIPENKYGFVYQITNLISGRMYIGRKYFWSKKNRQIKNKKKKFLVESDWQEYYGSSPDLLLDIEVYGKENFERKILGLYDTKGQTNYHEIKFQIQADVINAIDEEGNKIYYNKNIMARYFSPSCLDYEKVAEKQRIYWKSLSEEEKQERLKHLSGENKTKNMLNYWASLSEEEKQERLKHLQTPEVKKKVSSTLKKRFKQMDSNTKQQWIDSINSCNDSRAEKVSAHWASLTEAKKQKIKNKISGNNSQKRKIQITLNSNSSIIFNSIKDCADSLNISRHIVQNWLRGQSLSSMNTYNVLEIKYTDN